MEQKAVIRTERAPAPFRGAPYSQAIRYGNLVYISGQLPVDPATGRVAGETIGDQTERIFANIGMILEEAGSGLDKLVKVTVFIRSLPTSRA